MVKIVIIEDQPIILEGIKVLINQISDFKVVGEFANGKVFLDNLSKLDFDIVLTDIDMPVMDGVTTTKKAVAENPGMRIIALSMYNDHQYYLEMIMAGAKGFVLKQASVDELENAIRTVWDGNHFFSKELLHNVIVNMKNSSEENYLEDIIENISDREREIMEYICQGLTNKELAEKMFLSVKSIESIKTKLMQKTRTKNTAGLVIWAVKSKLVKI